MVMTYVNHLQTGLAGQFCFSMFHGVRTTRKGGRPRRDGTPTCVEEIAVNAYNLSEVICPYGDLIVSERLCQQINTIPGIQCVPVKLDKVFDMPWNKTPWPEWRMEFFGDDRRFLEALPDDPQARIRVGKRYQIVSTPAIHANEKFATSPAVEIACGQAPGFSERKERIALAALTEFPCILFWGFLLNEKLGAVLDRHLDR